MARLYKKIIKTEVVVNNCSECPAMSAEDGGIGGGYYFCEEIQKSISLNGIDKRCPMKVIKPSTRRKT